MSGIAMDVLETSIIEHVMGNKCYGKRKRRAEPEWGKDYSIKEGGCH